MSKRISLLLLLTLLTIGCRDIGRGGTGELVVPRPVLRQIDAIDPTEFAATQPATAPSTLPTTRPLEAPLREVPVTIEEVRQLALRNNLDLKVDLITPAIARETLNQEEARYEAVFFSDVSYATSQTPTATELEGSEVTSWRVNPGLQFPLRTGGLLQVSAPMDRFETNNQFATLNPAYSSDFVATLQQPLLRGGGIDVNAQGIRIAFYGYQRAQALTKLQIIRVLANAEIVYWRLYAARRALAVRRQEYDLAVAQLERARRQVAAGEAAEVETVRAQAGVADRVEAIITADNVLRVAERDLKRILNEPALHLQSAAAILPATEPLPTYFRVDPDRMIGRAMDGRMELLESELAIAQETANVRVARHETLPLVTLNYNYRINGLGSDLDESFSMVRDVDFEDHSVGVRLEVPIGNQAARSRLRQAMLRRLQELATREQRQLQIRQEVLDAADQLEVNWQRILAARQRITLARRLLDLEIRQFELGFRTSTEVLEAQTGLASAQLSEISAVTDYQIAQINLAQATGVLLGHARIDWQPVAPPRP